MHLGSLRDPCPSEESSALAFTVSLYPQHNQINSTQGTLQYAHNTKYCEGVFALLKPLKFVPFVIIVTIDRTACYSLFG
jgi:hypothetical protein